MPTYEEIKNNQFTRKLQREEPRDTQVAEKAQAKTQQGSNTTNFDEEKPDENTIVIDGSGAKEFNNFKVYIIKQDSIYLSNTNEDAICSPRFVLSEISYLLALARPFELIAEKTFSTVEKLEQDILACFKGFEEQQDLKLIIHNLIKRAQRIEFSDEFLAQIQNENFHVNVMNTNQDNYWRDLLKQKENPQMDEAPKTGDEQSSSEVEDIKATSQKEQATSEQGEEEEEEEEGEEYGYDNTTMA